MERRANEASLSLRVLLKKNSKQSRLLQEYRRKAAEYCRRTEVVPVIPAQVLREALVEKHHWIIENRLGAFGLHVHIVTGRDMEILYGLLCA